jgi:16S rRNA (cytidine1402-2'-O)-methyltransferase
MPLHIVSTPIGNLSDITFRAIDTLKQADLILAEDTRRTQTLLTHYKISTPMKSFNDHNKEKLTPTIIPQLKEQNISLVSDAGTPCISDPGFYLVREAIKHEISIHSIPGPSASIAALSISGLPTDKFLFLGFIPKKGRENFFTNLPTNTTIILYESPHRITKTLTILTKTLPEAQLCLARELTKKFETIERGTPEEILKKAPFKGEITLLIYKKG